MKEGHIADDRTRRDIETRSIAWLRCTLALGDGRAPFPWQQRLLKDHFAKGLSPDTLDIPTGLGKTSVIAIWLAARAARAALPRHLVYVVDRRAVVDQATEEAGRIKKIVDETPALKEALGLTRSLPISTLRGHYVDNRAWLEDPSVPAIVVGTVDLIKISEEKVRTSNEVAQAHVDGPVNPRAPLDENEVALFVLGDRVFPIVRHKH